jgi:hypothetical protein
MPSVKEIVYLHYPNRPVASRVIIGRISWIEADALVVKTRFGDVTFVARDPKWVQDGDGGFTMDGVLLVFSEKEIVILRSSVSSRPDQISNTGILVTDEDIDKLLIVLRPELYEDTFQGFMLAPLIPFWRSSVRKWLAIINGGV